MIVLPEQHLKKSNQICSLSIFPAGNSCKSEGSNVDILKCMTYICSAVVIILQQELWHSLYADKDAVIYHMRWSKIQYGSCHHFSCNRISIAYNDRTKQQAKWRNKTTTDLLIMYILIFIEYYVPKYIWRIRVGSIADAPVKL